MTFKDKINIIFAWFKTSIGNLQQIDLANDSNLVNKKKLFRNYLIDKKKAVK